MPKVFVHGNPESSDIWRPLLGALAARGVTDTTTLSPPGFGAPTPEGWQATQIEYRDWLIARLEEFDTPVDLVGHDWGAGHVLGALDARPDLMRSWATDCLGLFHPDYEWHDAAQAWQTPEVGEALIASMIEPPVADRVAMLVDLGMTDDVAPDVAAAMNDDMARCVLALYRSAAQPALADLGARLRNASLPPGLGLIAPDDHYAGSTAMAAEVAAALGADTVELPGCGHWWMFAGADMAADALVAHWERAQQ